MPDEPTLGELKRTMEAGFASVNASLAKVVSQEVFLAEQRRVDERHTMIAADITEEKADRVAAIAAERTERTTALAKETAEREKLSNRLWMVAASIAIPVVLFIANLIQGKPGS